MNRRREPASGVERCTRGATLVEAVTALTLLALLATGLVAVTGNGLRAWAETREALRQDRRLGMASLRLHEAISSIVPLVTPRPSGDSPQPFFQGEERMVRFVTGHSPVKGPRSGMRLVTLRAIPASGGGQLVLTDRPCPSLHELGAILEGTSGTAASRSEAAGEAESWIVAEEPADFSLEYLEIPTETDEPERWVRRWRDRNRVPRAVRIRWTSGTSSDGSRGAHEHWVTAAVIAEAETLGGLAR